MAKEFEFGLRPRGGKPGMGEGEGAWGRGGSIEEEKTKQKKYFYLVCLKKNYLKNLFCFIILVAYL